MNVEDSIELFLESKIADGLSMETVRWYRRRLGRMASFLGDVAIDQVQITELRRFVILLRDQGERFEGHPYRRMLQGGLSTSTQNGYVRAIKRLFNWLEAEGHLSTNPSLRLKLPRIPKQPPKGIELADLRALLNAAGGDSPVSIRNRALVLFLADTGCRVAGAVGLRVNDLSLDQNIAQVTEKGSKSRFVMFTDTTASALADWLAACPFPTEWVFPNIHTGKQLITTGVNRMLSQLRKRAGIEGRCNPHSFRHGFARQYILNGGDLATLSDLMGHSDIAVTKNFYSVFRVEELREKHRRHSPIAGLLLPDKENISLPPQGCENSVSPITHDDAQSVKGAR